MIWIAIWVPKAQKDLEKLPEKDIKRILLKTQDVEKNPFAHLERLSNSPYFKYRVGSYRIIVNVANDKLILQLLKVKKRSRAYD